MLLIKRLTPTALLPTRAHPGDAGLDLYADVTMTIPAGKWEAIPTGVAMKMEDWQVGQVCPRSGLALKKGVTVLNAPGIIDSTFTGEIKVILINQSAQDFIVECGMRIAQLVIGTFHVEEMIEVVNLPESLRGAGGFGSTGV